MRNVSNDAEIDRLYEDYKKIEKLWWDNFNQMGHNIKYILIGEAPHFGEEESYIYNPEFDRTPFLEFTHIESIAQSVGIGGVVRNKSDMLKATLSNLLIHFLLS